MGAGSGASSTRVCRSRRLRRRTRIRTRPRRRRRLLLRRRSSFGDQLSAERAAFGRPALVQRETLVGDGAAAGFGRVALLVRAIARAYERPREPRAEAERLALLAEPLE